MKYTLLFSFSFFLSVFSFGQSKEELSQFSFDAILDTIQKYQFSDMEKALEASKAYTLKGKRENDKEKEWKGMEFSILVHINFRNYETANEQVKNGLEFVRKNKLPKAEMQVLLLLGDLQGILATVEEQLSLYTELLDLAELHNNDFYREVAFSRIAHIK